MLSVQRLIAGRPLLLCCLVVFLQLEANCDLSKCGRRALRQKQCRNGTRFQRLPPNVPPVQSLLTANATIAVYRLRYGRFENSAVCDCINGDALLLQTAQIQHHRDASAILAGVSLLMEKAIMLKYILGASVVLTLGLGGLSGCAEKASVTTQSTSTGPGGTTTKTQSTEIKTTGENPPPAP